MTGELPRLQLQGALSPRLLCRVGVEGGLELPLLGTAPAHLVCLRESFVSTFLFSRFGRAKSGLVGVGWQGVFLSLLWVPSKAEHEPGT